MSVGVCWRLFVSVGVCWRLVFSGDFLGVSGRCIGDVWWYLSGIYGNRRRSSVFGGYLGYQSWQYGAIALFLAKPWKDQLFHLTLLRHQNITMFICKLDKNYCGYAISVVIVPVRNEWKISVVLDHPVVPEQGETAVWGDEVKNDDDDGRPEDN